MMDLKTMVTEVKNRDGHSFIINCVGCSYKDVTVKGYQGAEVPQELIISVNYPKTVKFLGFIKQDFEFGIQAKYDLKELKTTFSNGLLEINVPIKGGIVIPFDIKKEK